jgi:hypothetical protein
LIWAGAEEIGDEFKADVLLAALEVGCVVVAGVGSREGVASR